MTLLMRTKTVPQGNAHFNNPFTVGEIVKYEGEIPITVPRSFGRQFITVYRPRYKETQVLRRSYFESIKKRVINGKK